MLLASRAWPIFSRPATLFFFPPSPCSHLHAFLSSCLSAFLYVILSVSHVVFPIGMLWYWRLLFHVLTYLPRHLPTCLSCNTSSCVHLVPSCALRVCRYTLFFFLLNAAQGS